MLSVVVIGVNSVSRRGNGAPTSYTGTTQWTMYECILTIDCLNHDISLTNISRCDSGLQGVDQYTGRAKKTGPQTHDHASIKS